MLINKASGDAHRDPHLSEPESNQEDKHTNDVSSALNNHRTVDLYDIFMQLPEADLRNLCRLLGHEGLSDKVYMLAGEVLEKVASVCVTYRKFFTSEFSELANGLISLAVNELVTLRNTQMLGPSAGSMAGAAILRVLQVLSSLTSTNVGDDTPQDGSGEQEQQATMWKLNVSFEPLWEELSNCIGMTEAQLAQNSLFNCF